MFVDPPGEPSDSVKADICIIGGGPAGITLALEIARVAELQVILVESGGELPEQTNRAIYELLPGRRIRLGNDEKKPSYFGGNSNYWFGNCRPLEKEDFESREWMPYSGWPFGLQELKPYYERALTIAGVGGFHLYNPEVSGPLLPLAAPDLSVSLLETRIDQTTPVFRFADLYHRDLAAAKNIQVFLGTHVLSLRTNDGGDRVTEAEVVGRHGEKSTVKADRYVLATGAVENARVLLSSSDSRPGGLGNDSDMVGRFFMDHLYFAFAPWESGLDDPNRCKSLLFYSAGATGDREAAREHHFEIEGSRVFPKLAMSAEWMERERVPGLNIWIRPRRSPPKNLKTLRRFIASLRERRLPKFGDIQELLRDPLGTIRLVAWRLTGLLQPPEGFELIVQIEQKPDPANRIRLSTELDQFGQPTPEMELVVDEEQRRQHAHSLRTAAKALGLKGDELAAGLEEKYSAGEFDFIFHHMGTTRMDDDPAKGVVDRDCLVYGTSNLYVAGSSVFPTSGTAPPTLTIIALAVRLADHLKTLRLPDFPGPLPRFATKNLRSHDDPAGIASQVDP